MGQWSGYKPYEWLSTRESNQKVMDNFWMSTRIPINWTLRKSSQISRNGHQLKYTKWSKLHNLWLHPTTSRRTPCRHEGYVGTAGNRISFPSSWRFRSCAVIRRWQRGVPPPHSEALILIKTYKIRYKNGRIILVHTGKTTRHRKL